MLPDSIPFFARGMKFRFDETRAAWIVLGPERVFLPDEHAVAVLRLVDGTRSMNDIVGTLAAQFDAPHAAIAADVATMFDGLMMKGVIRT